MADDFSPERIADRLEIEHRVQSYARGMDRKLWSLARSAFHADAKDDHGHYKGGVDGLLDWAQERHRALPMSMHLITQIFIEFAADDEAFSESYYLAWQSVTGDANIMGQDPRPEYMRDRDLYEILSAGRYVDRFTRRDGAWRIQQRVTVVESTMVVPQPPIGGPLRFPAEVWEQSRRDEEDVSLRLRRELGIA